MTYKYWLGPIVGQLPQNVKQSGVFSMAIWAAINPMAGAWFIPPFYGIIFYLITMWWIYNVNPFNIIRSPSDPISRKSYWTWLTRTMMWSVVLHFIPLIIFYLILLGITKGGLMMKYSGY